MWWKCPSAVATANRCLAGACLLLTIALFPSGPAGAQSGGVDELVQLFGTRSTEAGALGARGAPASASTAEPAPCVSAAGDELVLRATKSCDMTRMAAVIRKAVARQERPRSHAGASDCRGLDRCGSRPGSFTKLSRYSSFAYERTQAGGPRYFGQKD